MSISFIIILWLIITEILDIQICVCNNSSNKFSHRWELCIPVDSTIMLYLISIGMC